MSVGKARCAAVLLILYEKEGEYYLILTKRTYSVMRHKGQVSLPGGEYEDVDETLENTARREGFEEIGLKPEDVKILGTLEKVKTGSSNFIITPFIATISFPYDFKVNTKEVEEIIEIPISFLLNASNFKNDSWIYNNHKIWGATARILNQFLEKVKKNGWDSLFSNI